MINAFQFKVNENYEDWTLEEEKEISNKIQEGLNLFSKYFFHLWF